ncbi:hypothetical protein [Pseudanabaena sp. SR411]|nr:hypothetical protein [Pseudanabaena sp. SR411]
MTTTVPFHRAGTRISRTKNRKVSVFVPPSAPEARVTICFAQKYG